MVKLFIGNLAEGVESDSLKNLFSQHVSVEECDVLKSYAFVHVETEEDADMAIEKFDKYNLNGKEIHVERSTSRLRKKPGMGDKCFTCGAEEHKTSHCPRNPNRKRNLSQQLQEPLVKKPKTLIFSHPDEWTEVPLQQNIQPNCWGYKVSASTDGDPELPCPQNQELYRLYEQYLESRTRYFFYREQLTKELRLQPQSTIAANIPANTNGNASNPSSVIRIDLTNLVHTSGQAARIVAARSLISEQPSPANPMNPCSSFIHMDSTSDPYSARTANLKSTTSYINNPPYISTMMSTLIKNEPMAVESIGGSTAQLTSLPTTHIPPQACQTIYSGSATHYNTLPSRKSTAPSTKQQPTPLAAVQPFGYNLLK